MLRHRIVILAISIAALAVGAALLMRYRLTEWAPPHDLSKFADDTARHFRATDMRRADDREGVIALFASAPVLHAGAYDRTGAQIADPGSIECPLSGFQKSLLFETVAEFIEIRSRADADEYASWMRDRGYALQEHDELVPGMERRFRILAGREISPQDSAWDVFALAYEGELLHGRAGPTRPAGIAIGDGAAEVWVGKHSSNAPLHDAFLPLLFSKAKHANESGDMSSVRLHMGQRYEGWRHWTPPVSADALIERDGEVACAQVNLVVRTRDGGAIPTALLLYYDPNAEAWHFEQFAYVNTYEIELGLGPVY